ncbi:MAG: bifunctional riboflavin kinase/FAD synthetase [Actinomycetota bacterium]|nr:bifunctional riboflavin kinase/FAD synthetase [Actinomycetota bacterium]
MHIWRSMESVPAGLGPSVVVIGNFDGVHLGHLQVLDRARAIADTESARLVVVTFDPHPMAVLRPEHAPRALTNIDQRSRLLHEAGADDVLVLPFSREIASWSPEEFIERVLVETLHSRAVVVGANFRFGAKAAGDVATLTSAGERHGFRVEGVALEGGPQVWSSTYVRTCLSEGDVEGAAQALGRPYAVTGVVVRGERRGHQLGFPTANVPPGGVATPADGVYAGWLRRLDDADAPATESMPAALSVGTNPTFAGERDRRVEAYVLDRTDLELYDVLVEISFVHRIRQMSRFDSVDELVAAMKDDVAQAHVLLGA